MDKIESLNRRMRVKAKRIISARIASGLRPIEFIKQILSDKPGSYNRKPKPFEILQIEELAKIADKSDFAVLLTDSKPLRGIALKIIKG